jgi:hypothetical protein
MGEPFFKPDAGRSQFQRKSRHNHTDYKASLIRGKVYRVIPDPRAAKDDLVRMVDESGEDSLFHKSFFVLVDCPKPIAKKPRSLETTPA